MLKNVTNYPSCLDERLFYISLSFSALLTINVVSFTSVSIFLYISLFLSQDLIRDQLAIPVKG